MLQKFQNFVEENNLFNVNSKILLAVSGGIDSMVMLDLFNKAGYHFSIAHCNFKIRGEEADQDAYFVQQQAVRLGCEYHEKSFETLKFARSHSISVQMAARDLRYQWFEELLSEYAYDAYASAHHQDDLVETFLINLSRSTGIAGLSGMKPKIGNRIRPLLFTNSTEIEAYKNANHILFREDSSNQDQKYLRNQMRHQIIPLFKEINPAFSENLVETMEYLKSIEFIYHDFINEARSKCILDQDENTCKISIEQLTSMDYPEACLFEFLQPYNFNKDVVRDVFSALKGSSGKIFISHSHRLLHDRKYLIVEPKVSKDNSSFQYYIEEKTKAIEQPVRLEFKKREYKRIKIDPSPLIAHLDIEKLSFPLVIRKWKEGDYFYPLGMEGKKKISDFLIDIKIPVFDKERIWLLCSEEQVVWVIGLRIDDRFKITTETQSVFRAEVKY